MGHRRKGISEPCRNSRSRDARAPEGQPSGLRRFLQRQLCAEDRLAPAGAAAQRGDGLELRRGAARVPATTTRVECPQADRKAADLCARDKSCFHTRCNDRAGSAGPGAALRGDACAKQALPGHAASPSRTAAARAKRHRSCADHAIQAKRCATGTNDTHPGGTHPKRSRTWASSAVPGGTDSTQAERCGICADRSRPERTDTSPPDRQGPGTGCARSDRRTADVGAREARAPGRACRRRIAPRRLTPAGRLARLMLKGFRALSPKPRNSTVGSDTLASARTRGWAEGIPSRISRTQPRSEP
jgi:hypothetical protein